MNTYTLTMRRIGVAVLFKRKRNGRLPPHNVTLELVKKRCPELTDLESGLVAWGVYHHLVEQGYATGEFASTCRITDEGMDWLQDWYDLGLL